MIGGAGLHALDPAHRRHDLLREQLPRARATSLIGSAVALATTGKRGALNGADSSAAARPGTAGAMSGEWKAPLTLSGRTRLAPAALQASPARVDRRRDRRR